MESCFKFQNVSSFASIKHGIDDMLHRNKPTNIIYLITIKIGRYTKEEREILDHIFKNQRAMMRNAMIIFTNRNELIDEDDPADQNVDEDYISKENTIYILCIYIWISLFMIKTTNKYRTVLLVVLFYCLLFKKCTTKLTK
jgi:hypothetical protein